MHRCSIRVTLISEESKRIYEIEINLLLGSVPRIGSALYFDIGTESNEDQHEECFPLLIVNGVHYALMCDYIIIRCEDDPEFVFETDDDLNCFLLFAAEQGWSKVPMNDITSPPIRFAPFSVIAEESRKRIAARKSNEK